MGCFPCFGPGREEGLEYYGAKGGGGNGGAAGWAAASSSAAAAGGGGAEAAAPRAERIPAGSCAASARPHFSPSRIGRSVCWWDRNRIRAAGLWCSGLVSSSRGGCQVGSVAPFGTNGPEPLRAGVGAIEGNDRRDARGGVSLGSSSIRRGEAYRLLLYRQIQKLYLMMAPLISSWAIVFSPVMIGVVACFCMTVSWPA